MSKISVIIPAYNAEKYINRAVQSVLSQSLHDLEVIVIDDGSTDNTYHICKQINDDRILVIHQENAGPAAARNKGLELASGEYIGFVDSDDVVDPFMYEKLYTVAIKTGADVINGSFQIVDENEADLIISKNNEIISADFCITEREIELLRGQELQSVIRMANAKRILWFAVKGIYRNDLLKKHTILFPEGVILGEETPFVLECMLCSEIVANLKHEKLYYYIQRKGSLTKTKHSSLLFKQLNNLYNAKKAVYEKYGFIGYEQDLNQYTMSHTIPMILSNEIKSGRMIREQAQMFRTIRNSEMISEAVKHCSPMMIKSNIRWLALLLGYRRYYLLSLLCK